MIHTVDVSKEDTHDIHSGCEQCVHTWYTQWRCEMGTYMVYTVEVLNVYIHDIYSGCKQIVHIVVDVSCI